VYGFSSDEQADATACPVKPAAHFQPVTENPQPTFKSFSFLDEASYPNGFVGAVQTAAAEESTKKESLKERRRCIDGAAQQLEKTGNT
jgi:hypothetical protein|tara:strand:- start:11 stop:274 length:264 start_codon:yes stop_codon:yes gene_type:complete